MAERRPRLREAAARHYDVIVVGGGINGAGIARDAAQRGLRVLLLDQHDWAFGTTWRSTKLIHGGLRYLEHGEVGLVFESLRDRAALLRTAPHLVRPMSFLLPVFRGNRYPKVMLRAGLATYDLLALGGGLPWHRSLSAEQAIAAVPALRQDGLRGGLGYWDTQVALPERLCLENVLRAEDDGAVAVSYARVERLNHVAGTVSGVSAVDLITGDTAELTGTCVVNAAGPWVDAVLRRGGLKPDLIGGTRGAHIVVRFPNGGPRRTVYSEAQPDRRPFFIIPWRGVHLVGTTDVRVRDPEETLPSDAEMSYLFEAVNALLPGDRLSPADVWYSYAGIRALPRTENGKEGAITRRHHIVDHTAEGFAGLLSVVGGKLSTYRSLSQQVTDRLFRHIGMRSPPCETTRLPLLSGDWRPDPTSPNEQRLWRIYGPRAAEVLHLAGCRPELAQPLCPHTLETAAQALHAARREGALTVADVLLRRTPAGWSRCLGLDAAPAVAALLAGELGWPSDAIAPAIEAYEAEVARTFRRM